MKINKWTMRIGIILVIGTVCVGVATTLINIHVNTYGSHIIDSVKDAPTRDVAIILGGGMLPNGEMTAMQYDRVLAGISLYNEGRVVTLVMSGDDGSMRKDEVRAMRKLAIDSGVPAEDIIVDGSSFRTYETCYRAVHVYGFQNVLVVSQHFHLPRIRYLCESMGLHTVAVGADLREYNNIHKAWNRERMANVKAWLELNILKPYPHNMAIWHGSLE